MGSIHNEIKVNQCLFWGEFSPLGLKGEKMWFIKLGSLWKKMPKLQDFKGEFMEIAIFKQYVPIHC